MTTITLEQWIEDGCFANSGQICQVLRDKGFDMNDEAVYITELDHEEVITLTKQFVMVGDRAKFRNLAKTFKNEQARRDAESKNDTSSTSEFKEPDVKYLKNNNHGGLTIENVSNVCKSRWKTTPFKNYIFQTNINEKLTRYGLKRPMIVAFYEPKSINYNPYNYHASIRIIYFTKLGCEQQVQDLKESQLEETKMFYKLGIRIFIIELKIRENNFDINSHRSNYNNNRKILRIEGPLTNSIDDRKRLISEKCSKFFLLKKMSVKMIVDKAMNIMHTHGEYKKVTNNCLHYSQKLWNCLIQNDVGLQMEQKCDNNSVCSSSLISASSFGSTKVLTQNDKMKFVGNNGNDDIDEYDEKKQITFSTDCDRLQQYVHEYFLDGFDKKNGNNNNNNTKWLVNDPVSYNQVLKEFGLKEKMDCNVIYSGNLWVESGILKRWHHRYCVFTIDKKFSIYEKNGKKNKTAMKMIDLKRGDNQIRNQDDKEFEVSTSRYTDPTCMFCIGNVRFEAEHTNKKKEWVTVLQQHIGQNDDSILTQVDTGAKKQTVTDLSATYSKLYNT